jgi:Type IX secretion system protein PorV
MNAMIRLEAAKNGSTLISGMKTIMSFVLFSGLVIASFISFPQPALAQYSGGSTAASFLKVGTDAQSAGFGGAYTAIASNGSAARWNPAGLAGQSQSQVMLSHFSWLQDVNIENVAVLTPVNDQLVVGGNFTYVNYGSISGYTESNIATGDISVYDFAGSVSFGLQIADNLGIGASAKIIRQSLGADVSASAVAFDAGALLTAGHVRFGATLNNIGQKMTFIQEGDALPASARLGVAASPFGSTTMGAVDVEIPFDGEIIVRSGVEYSFSGAYFLRGGYSFFPGQDERDYGSGAAFGAGLRMDNYQIDYAFSPAENLNSEAIHRFSFSVNFGK